MVFHYQNDNYWEVNRKTQTHKHSKVVPKCFLETYTTSVEDSTKEKSQNSKFVWWCNLCRYAFSFCKGLCTKLKTCTRKKIRVNGALGQRTKGGERNSSAILVLLLSKLYFRKLLVPPTSTRATFKNSFYYRQLSNVMWEEHKPSGKLLEQPLYLNENTMVRSYHLSFRFLWP